jgi:hypothetical protein
MFARFATRFGMFRRSTRLLLVLPRFALAAFAALSAFAPAFMFCVNRVGQLLSSFSARKFRLNKGAEVVDGAPLFDRNLSRSEQVFTFPRVQARISCGFDQSMDLRLGQTCRAKGLGSKGQLDRPAQVAPGTRLDRASQNKGPKE